VELGTALTRYTFGVKSSYKESLVCVCVYACFSLAQTSRTHPALVAGSVLFLTMKRLNGLRFNKEKWQQPNQYILPNVESASVFQIKFP